VHHEPGPEESLDRLSAQRRVLQRRKGHRSGTDDTLAAWLASRVRPDAGRVVDLGCGHATVTLLLSQRLPGATFVCVEYQPISAALARRNLALNGLEARARVAEGDLRDFEHEPVFDLATGTPPFMPVGSGLLAKDPQRAAARFELAGGIEAYLATAARLLAEHGLVSLLMDGDQDARCLRAFDAVGLHLHRTLVVFPRAGRSARYRGYVGGRRPAERIARDELTIRDEDGQLTDPMRAVRRELELDLETK
jgi:tRNA1Val (adenine37-N6)-methyltransferase